MTDVEILRVLCLVAVASWAMTLAYSLRWMVHANGHAPLLRTILLLSFLSVAHTLAVTYTAFSVDRMSDGWARNGVYFGRLALAGEAWVVLALGWRIMRR